MKIYILLLLFLHVGVFLHGQKQNDLNSKRLSDLEYFKKEILKPDQLDEEDLEWKKRYKKALVLEYSGFAIVAGATGYLAYKLKKYQKNNNKWNEFENGLSVLRITALLMVSGLIISSDGTRKRKQTLSDFRSFYDDPKDLMHLPKETLVRLNITSNGLSLSYQF